MSLNLVLVYILVVCIAIAYLLVNPRSECLVIITGESVKVLGCDQVDGFADFITKLKPVSHERL